ncbi:MAG: insulinase family protein, partial [Bacteroidia bacterium]|nr:insulinase family protein [Bacteroidia bacterium]
VENLARKYFEFPFENEGAPVERLAPARVPACERRVQSRWTQAHLVVGGYAPPYRSDDYYAFAMLAFLLGGPSLNCRLNLNVREKYGLTYSIYAFYNPYVCDGNWGVYAGCDARQIERVKKLIEKELDALTNSTLSQSALKRLKRQYLGGMALQLENPSSFLTGAARDLLDFGQILTPDAIAERYRALTAEDLRRVAQQTFAQRFWVVYEPQKS